MVISFSRRASSTLDLCEARRDEAAMLVLAIDTCLARCAVCLFDSVKNHALAQEHKDIERGHAEALAPMVQHILAMAGKRVKDIDRIVVTTGPGTFTGLRIGLSFARAFGLARNIPVLGLDTLHAFRLCTDEKNTLALIAGQSSFAYVLRAASDEIELVPLAELGIIPLIKGFPDLQHLAIWAAGQPSPVKMPDPIYIRQADAKVQVVVKQVNGDAADTLSVIHHSAFSVGWSPAEIAAMFSVKGTQGFIAEIASEPVGIAITRTLAGQAEIITIATIPARRHIGVAAKLLSQAVTAMKTLGAETLFLEVAHTNTAARNLYAKAGLTETGRRKAYYNNGDDAIVMSRGLV